MSQGEIRSVVECWAAMLETTYEILETKGSVDAGGEKSLNSRTKKLSTEANLAGSQSTRRQFPAQNKGSHPNLPPFAKSLFERDGERIHKYFSGGDLRQELPIVINGTAIRACHDSCAGGNFIQEQLAKDLQLELRYNDEYKNIFILGNGKIVKSIGETTTECTFALDSSHRTLCSFHVLTDVALPLVFGYPFLKEHGILFKNRHRLQARSRMEYSTPTLSYMNSPLREELQFKCRINEKETMATVDSGSDLDLMSSSYVKERGMKLLIGTRDIQLADASTLRTSGMVLVNLDVSDGRSFLKHFYVLEGLESGVLLGQNTLESFQAFTRLQDSLVEVSTSNENASLRISLDLGPVNRIIRRMFKGTGATSGQSDPISADPHSNDAFFEKKDEALYVEANRQDALIKQPTEMDGRNNAAELPTDTLQRDSPRHGMETV